MKNIFLFITLIFSLASLAQDNEYEFQPYCDEGTQIYKAFYVHQGKLRTSFVNENVSLINPSGNEVAGYCSSVFDSIKIYGVEGYNDSNVVKALEATLTVKSDSVYYTLVDSLVKLLQPKTDTVKVPVWDIELSLVTGIDTFFNCNGLSFRWLSTSTGTVDFTGSVGSSITIPAGESTPLFPSDGITFYKQIIVDATSSSGVLVNAKGCNDGNPCVTLKTLEDCSTGEVEVTCNGWASISGIWYSNGKCWNTGQ